MMFHCVRSLPNIISATRLLGSPLLLVIEQSYVKWFFSLLALSDALDGFLARSLKAQSNLGKVLDPLADKVMMFFAFLVCVFKLRVLPEYLFYMLLMRDVFILMGSVYLFKRKGVLPSPSPWGKLTTFTLSLTIVVHLFGYESQILVFLSLLFTLYSWTDYFIRGLHILRYKKDYPY